MDDKPDHRKSADQTWYGPDPTNNKIKSAFKHKQATEYYDPCADASKQSLKCLDRNNYDHSKCEKFFQVSSSSSSSSSKLSRALFRWLMSKAYRDCKKKWQYERRKGNYYYEESVK